jgi:hypothetical protein
VGGAKTLPERHSTGKNKPFIKRLPRALDFPTALSVLETSLLWDGGSGGEEEEAGEGPTEGEGTARKRMGAYTVHLWGLSRAYAKVGREGGREGGRARPGRQGAHSTLSP